jgi:uncharacterized cupredoxin-like copper-binding protein
VASPLQRSSSGDRNTLSVFAALMSVGAFLLAAIGVVVVVTKDSGTSSTSAALPPVEVQLSEFKITPATINVPAGPVSLAVKNGGSQIHNLDIPDLNKKTKDLNAGQSETLDLGSLEAGKTYNVICNIPGHEAAGMVATLVVNEGTGGGAINAADTATGSHGAADPAVFAKQDQAMVDGANAYVADVVESATAVLGGAPAEPTIWGPPGVQGTPSRGAGNQRLQPTTLPDGTLEFNIESKIIDWEVEPGKIVKAWAYNEMVPGPWIKVPTNTKVRLVLKNSLPQGTDVHFHGITTPFPDDGVAPITQPMIKPGESWTYEFTTPATPEVGMYHAHNHGQVSVVNGMFAQFQVGDLKLPAGKSVNDVTVPDDIQQRIAANNGAHERVMVLNDAGVIGLSLSGKAFPATDPIVSRVGDWDLLHYQNEGLQSHPMHLHHMPQLVVAKDGIPLEQPYWVDTLNVAPGERYSVLIQTRDIDINVDAPVTDPALKRVGIWAFHCHILTHAENDNGLFGMVTAWVTLPAS